MRHLQSLPTLLAFLLLAQVGPAQHVLSLDDTRTEDALLGFGDYYLTGPGMAAATLMLQNAGMTVSTTDRFLTANMASADILFTGLVDVPFTGQELTDIDAFVTAGGGLVIMRDWGNFGNERDALATVFGVTYSGTVSGIAGTPTAVNKTAAHPIWDGPAGSVTSFNQVYSGSITSGATILGTHITDGKAAIGVVSHGAGTVVFLTDSAPWGANNTMPAPSLGNDHGKVWLNIFASFGPGTTGTPYCFGDGSGAACPCGAVGAVGEGCPNSAATGATLVGFGDAVFSADTFRLEAAGAPGVKPGLILRADNQIASPVGDGILCAAGNSQRSQVQITVAGATSFTDFNGSSFSSVANLGSPTNFQFWYRDPGTPCGGGFNFSNGVSVTYLP